MKVVLVLCALVAVGNCGLVEYFEADNCVGLRKDNSYRNLTSGSWISQIPTSKEICCNFGFPKNHTFDEFDQHMRQEEIRSVVHNSFIGLMTTRKDDNCRERGSPARITGRGADKPQIFRIENCIGIHQDASYINISTGRWVSQKATSYEICCDFGFSTSDDLNGYTETMNASDIKDIVHENFLEFFTFRRNCIERESPARFIPPSN